MFDVDAALVAEGRVKPDFEFKLREVVYTLPYAIPVKNLQSLRLIANDDPLGILGAIIGKGATDKLIKAGITDIELRAIMEAYEVYKGVSVGEQ